MGRIKSFPVFILESAGSVSYFSDDFSKETGIKVSQDWNIPGDDEEIQDELIKLNKINSDESWTIDPIRKMWRKFSSLNPQIENWIIAGKGPLVEAKQKWDIMFGMVSKYNEDDIQSFLTRKGYDVKKSDRERMEKIEDKTGVIIQWVPSLKTLKYIEDNL
jgi:hypothetical protein